MTTASAARPRPDRVAQLLARLVAHHFDAGGVGHARCWRRPGHHGTAGAASGPARTPWRPEDRLPRKRTGSRFSRVPPAETTTLRPTRSRSTTRGRHVDADGVDLLGLGQPALAGVGAGQAPDRGLEDQRAALPQGRDVGLGRGVPHISVCIAGASMTGHRATSRVSVSRSSAGRGRRGRAGPPWRARRRPARPACPTRRRARPGRRPSKTSVVTGSPTGPPRWHARRTPARRRSGTTRDVVARTR